MCSIGVFPCFYNVRQQKSEGGMDKTIDAEVCARASVSILLTSFLVDRRVYVYWH